MPTIIGSGAGNAKALKGITDLLRSLTQYQDHLAELAKEQVEAIKEITDK